MRSRLPRSSLVRVGTTFVGIALWASAPTLQAQTPIEDKVTGSCKSLVAYQSGTGVALTSSVMYVVRRCLLPVDRRPRPQTNGATLAPAGPEYQLRFG